jgi:RNA polymerase sigma-70 factor (ECF subfamily)
MTTVMTAPLSPEILKYSESLLSHIRSIVREPAEADDALQETLVRAHQTVEQLRDESALGTWLFRIATHIALDHLRQRSRRPKVDEHELEEIQEDDDSAPTLQNLVEQREMSACVQRYLLELPPDYRTVILLHDLEGLTAAEIAEVLEISLANAKVRLHRARERLREALLGGCKFSCDCRGVIVCEPKT